MRIKKSGFTLTELLIAIGVVGVLSAILLPIIFHILPDQKKMMAKRSYYATQVAVSEMINDQSCYPDRTAEDLEGFDDIDKYKECKKWKSAGTAAETPTGTDQDLAKFEAIFSDILDRNTDSSSEDYRATSDGVIWDIRRADAPYLIDIVVDVNGTEKPNCGQSSTAQAKLGDLESECSPTPTKYDRYAMHVMANGKIDIDTDDTWARDAVRVDADISESK